MEKGLKDGYFKNWSGIKNCVILNFSASLPGKLRSVVTSHVLSGSAWVLYVFKLHPLPKYSMLTLNEKIKKQNINKQSHRYLGKLPYKSFSLPQLFTFWYHYSVSLVL